ncbi:hypothetical protein [Lactobacillus delbrueckii]
MQLGIIGSGNIVRDFLTALPLPGLKLVLSPRPSDQAVSSHLPGTG